MDRHASDETRSSLGMLLFYLFFISLIVLQVLRSRRRRRELNAGAGLAEVAARLGGEVVRVPALESPLVCFAVRGAASSCHQWILFQGRSDVVTTLECRIGFPAFFEATDRKALRYPSRSSRFRALSDVANFQIVTTDAAWAQQLLQGRLGGILQELRSLGRRARIQLAADRFLVEIESYLDAESVEILVQRVLTPLADLGRAVNGSAGVSFLGETQVAEQGRCPVCCQSYSPPGVSCPQCRTPHHSDCWEYWGRCAIFGCRGRGGTVTSASPG